MPNGTRFDYEEVILHHEMNMHRLKMNFIKGTSLGLSLLLLGSTALQAQNRLVIPRGSVIVVTTASVLESSTARAGQTFETIVADSIRVDNYTVIPEGSRIRGVVVVAQPATRQQSGVMEVNFDRLTLTDGTFFPIDGRLTSLDSAERRQIESQTDQRVVLVGGRGGIGGAIAGAGSSSSGISGILSALGSLLSEGQNVRVPAGTPLAVQLEQRLVLRGRGIARRPDASTIYTDAERVREAQRALSQLNYYRGSIDGELTYATQRALFEYQIDKGLSATGNLDGRTAEALGLSLDGVGTGGTVGSALTIAEATNLRRSAQTAVSRGRLDFSISTIGRLDPRRTYSAADIELWFALSAFADNASLYEQVVRAAGNTDGAVLAGQSLVHSARRVDTAMTNARTTSLLRNEWSAIRSQVARIDHGYN